ncbi:MAG: hypothetical protein CL927_00530 [Deltaproteobacteria bacterium]|nr:hypothetical protein [Deltaproteobacteria bacterium]HCH61485.1 hypothetical protein [Deltaproteobacteria bacterium]
MPPCIGASGPLGKVRSLLEPLTPLSCGFRFHPWTEKGKERRVLHHQPKGDQIVLGRVVYFRELELETAHLSCKGLELFIAAFHPRTWLHNGITAGTMFAAREQGEAQRGYRHEPQECGRTA